MNSNQETPRSLNTTIGEFPLQQCRIAVGGREWSILHTEATVSYAQETDYLGDSNRSLPYGVALWPAAIVLAHEIATREVEFRNRDVLELGAGTGMPGIIAAGLGARVVQTDRHELPLHLCRLNSDRNGIRSIEHREADWTAWPITERFDWILGSDILYVTEFHSLLRRIFESNLKAGGRVLLSDPFRSQGMSLLESLEKDGWRITMSRWNIDDGRPIGVYEMKAPSA